MERLTSRNEDCVSVNGHGLYHLTMTEVVQMADRLADYEDMDSKRIRPGDTVWLSQMFYTRPKKPVPVTVDAIRIDREGTTYITGRQIGEDGKPIRGTGKMVFDWFQWERDGKDIPKIHPTQKPVKVLRRLIEIFTDPGELVIDPVCGSGSTLRAAAEAGRSAIGFEIDKSFYMAAKEKMLAGVREAQKTARDAGSQITIGEIAEAARQGG